MLICLMQRGGGARLVFIPAPLATFALVGYYWKWDTPFMSQGPPGSVDCSAKSKLTNHDG